jgi:Tol biopolymer transport system component
MNADGSEQRRLTSGSRPSWSPDGRRIAFLRGGPGLGSFELYAMNADGSGQRKLVFTRHATLWWALSLPSPDGRKVAFVSDLDGITFRIGATEISVVNLDGSGQRNLTDTSPARLTHSPARTVNDSPVWSPAQM